VADLDPVVEKADAAEGDDGEHHQVTGAREADVGADVTHEEADDDGPHDGHAPMVGVPALAL